MKKTFLFNCLLIVVFCCAVVSCPEPDQIRWIRGRVLTGYPDWLYLSEDNKYCFGVTDWLDWQSEEGKKLHNLVSNDVMQNDFTGKFRLLLCQQDTSIVFNDEHRTCCILFYNWVYKVNSTNISYSFEQEDSTVKFEYPCHVKTDLRDGETNSNKGFATLTRLSTTSELPNRFDYKLIINGATVIKCELYNGFEIKRINNPPDWLPENVGSFGYNYNKDIGYEIHTSDFYMQLDKSNIRKGGLYCFEGITLKEVDDTNKRISFWLEDRANSGFADYVTLKMHNDLQHADISYYKDGVAEPICTDANVQCFYE